MIVDTSAILAVLLDEQEAVSFTELIASIRCPKMSAVSYVEAALRIDWNKDPILSGLLDELLRTFEIAVVDVTPEQARIARIANKDFGKGSGHPAKLNFGDCFSYALAKVEGDILLFKGNDFVFTDIESAMGQAIRGTSKNT